MKSSALWRPPFTLRRLFVISLTAWAAYWLVLSPPWEGVSYMQNYTGDGLHRSGTFSLASDQGGFHPLWQPPTSGGGLGAVVRWPLQPLPSVGENQQLYVVKVSEMSLVTRWCAGLLGLGLLFGAIQKTLAPAATPDWVILAGWNCALALSVAFLALLVLGAVSMGYAWTPPIVLGTLLSAVAIGLGMGWFGRAKSVSSAASNDSPTVGSMASDRPPMAAPDGFSAAPQTMSQTHTDAPLESATEASQAQPPNADAQLNGPAVRNLSDSGTNSDHPATTDLPAPAAKANRVFSLGAFVLACFVMVPVAWIAVDLAAPHRGPQSPHVTPLGTHEYLQDQGPVNRTLALGIALTALVIAKVAWRPGWRSFAAGILVSGLLLALLALGLHR